MRADGEASQRSPTAGATMASSSSSSSSGAAGGAASRQFANGGATGAGGSSSNSGSGSNALSPPLLQSPTFAKVANGSNNGASGSNSSAAGNGQVKGGDGSNGASTAAAAAAAAGSAASSSGSSTSSSGFSNGHAHYLQQQQQLNSNQHHLHRAPPPTGPYFGHDREEVTRILIQGLTDLGYHSAARSLSKESGFALEGPEVAAFRSAVLSGDWPEAELLLFGSAPTEYEDISVGGGIGGAGVLLEGSSALSGKAATNGSGSSSLGALQGRSGGGGSGGLTLAEGANKNEMLFWVRQQKYLELLESRDLGAALGVLRQELTPLHQDQGRLHALSSLLMCASSEDLRMQAQWDGASGESRTSLLSELSKSISPSVMIPERRLAVLLDEVKDNWIQNCPYHNTTHSPSLYHDHSCDREEFPLHVLMDLCDHKDEVWFLAFSNDGTKLATAGKDCHVLIYDTRTWAIIHDLPDHNNGVCYVAWSPDDTKIITCTQAQDASARLWDAHTGKIILTLSQLTYSVTSAAWAPNGETFVIGSHDVEDPLCVWNIDNRRVYQWKEDSLRVHDLSISPDGQRLVVLLENRVLVYDFVSREKIAEWAIDGVKTTSINISADSKHMLVSMNENSIRLMVIDTGEVLQTFEGHRQTEFVVRSAFGGANENFVVSGSEDSRIYIWRTNGALVEVLDAHPPGCVNAVAWHPKNPCVFASAGDDHKVRIWAKRSFCEEYHQLHR